jgi:surface antigen
MFSKKGLHPIATAASNESTYSSPARGYQEGPTTSGAAGVPAMYESPTSVMIAEQPASAIDSPSPVQRTPIFVPATGKKSSGTMRPPKPRRLVINIGVAVVLLLVVGAALAAVIPTGNGQASGLFGIFNPQMSAVITQSKQTALIAAQAATATAVMTDGYDAGGNVTYAGVNRDYSLNNGQSTLDVATGGSASTASAGGTVSASNLVIRATPGQCTYWADYRYWQLTGYEVPWAGNADTYAYQAASYGWINAAVPVLHSIIVLQPGVQNAGLGTGHVGIVEGINADGSLNVSSWNIVGPGILTYSTYYAGAGVSFVYHP